MGDVHINKAWIEGFGTLTGSSLNPLCRPKDKDYFASKKCAKELERLCRFSKTRMEYNNAIDDPSVEHWTGSVCFKFELDGESYDVFFVGDEYHKALTAYTDVMKELCKDEHWAGFLAAKSNRVALAESFRKLYNPI